MTEFSGYFEVVVDGDIRGIGHGDVEIKWGDTKGVHVVQKHEEPLELPDNSKEHVLELKDHEITVKGCLFTPRDI